MSVHDDVRAKIAPLTDALTNCVTELELLPIEHRVRVMRALNALFQEPAQSTWQQLGGSLSAKQQSVLDGMTPIGFGAR